MLPSRMLPLDIVRRDTGRERSVSAPPSPNTSSARDNDEYVLDGGPANRSTVDRGVAERAGSDSVVREPVRGGGPYGASGGGLFASTLTGSELGR